VRELFTELFCLPSNKLDLVDEWYDLTELPYVHGFWAFREEVLEELDFKQIERQSLSQTGMLAKFGDDAEYLESFRYELNEGALRGLSEFYRMAFYHGIMKEIPDVRFF